MQLFSINCYTWKILDFVCKIYCVLCTFSFYLLPLKNIAYDIILLFQEQLRDFGALTAKVNSSKIFLLQLHFKNSKILSENFISGILSQVHDMGYHQF